MYIFIHPLTHICIDIRMGEGLATKSRVSLKYVCHKAKIISLKICWGRAVFKLKEELL